MGKLAKYTRRTLLIGSVAIAGGVAIGYWKYRQPYDNPLLADLGEDEAALTPYVLIDADGIAIIAPRAEMGQGVHTTLAALVAEELDVALDAVRVLHGPASKAYLNSAILEEGLPFAQIDESWMAENARRFTRVPAKFLGLQITGGSSSIPDGFDKMRRAGAAARQALVAAAADRLGVEASALSTDNGSVVAPDGTRLAYTELAADAATMELRDDPPLKRRDNWKLLGRSLPRVDMVDKCAGVAEFGVDVQLDGMRYATVRANPRLGGALNGFDASAAEAMRGVERIVELDGAVAVVATNTWYAFQAAEAIDCDWGDAPYPASSAAMLNAMAETFDDGYRDSRFRDDGDVEAAMIEADVIEAEYRVPFLAHATMEPMNATAWLRDGRLDVWAGTQAPTQALIDAEAITGLPREQIRIHTPFLGGGFGRRAEMDYVIQAVTIAKAMEGTPVKLTWTRPEDMTHDFYRPAALARLRATVRADGSHAFDLGLSTLSVMESQMGRANLPAAGPDVTIVQAAWDQPYAFDHYRVTGYRVPAMLPVSSWRSVGASQNGFFHESAIDEMAHAAGADPLEFRLSAIRHEPSRKVLEAVAEMSHWGAPLPDGHARGVAFVLSFGVPVAEVIEVAVSDGTVRLVNAYAAADVGLALDPRNIEAQVQSGIVFGLSAAIQGEITVADGAIEQTNFHQYDGLRMRQVPPMQVRILENGSRIRGIGEPGLPPAAPALANAIFAATGQRIRELPLRRHIDFA